MRRLPMRATLLTCLATTAATTAAGCGGVSQPAGPHLIPGGGTGDGKIAGALYVYVTDDDTRAPVSSATVRLGEASATAPCQGLTDSTGLATFDAANCAGLKGPITLTASAAGYAPSTWIGVDATNLTVPVRAKTPATLGTATVSGTIAGWDTMPAPAADHMTVALIGFSQSPDLGDRANDVAQGMRPIDVMVGNVVVKRDFAQNICVRNANPVLKVNDCNWRLTTRTGAQAHFAIIMDQDTKGTESDTDDTQTVIGWAFKTNLTLSAGDNVSGEELAPLGDADMQPFTASFVSPPSGMDVLGAYPALDLGDAGRIPIIFPKLDLTHTSSRVPKPAGALAGTHYDLIASAHDAQDQQQPSTLTWLRNVSVSATVAVSAWMPPPTALSTTGGTFSFSPVPGATLHSAEIKNPNGERAWSITIFDGSTSFALPGLSPDPIQLGTVTFGVSALRIPGFNLSNASFEDARDLLTDLSTEEITYTR